MNRHSNERRQGRGLIGTLVGLVGTGIAVSAVVAVMYEPAKRKIKRGMRQFGEYLDEQTHRMLKLALGMDVDADDMKLSLIDGRFIARGVRLTAYGADEPLAEIGTIRAVISAGDLLKGNLRIESLLLDEPVISIRHRADGSVNVPDWLLPQVRQIPHKAEMLVEGAEMASTLPLGFTARRIEITGGEMHFEDETAGNYHVAARGLHTLLNQTREGYKLFTEVESVARIDQPNEMGASHGEVQIKGSHDLSKFADAEVVAHFHLPPEMELTIHSPSLRSRHVAVQMNGSAELGTLVPMIPPNLTSALAPLAAGGTQGQMTLSLQMEFDPEHGLRVEHARTDMHDVAVGTPEQTGS